MRRRCGKPREVEVYRTKVANPKYLGDRQSIKHYNYVFGATVVIDTVVFIYLIETINMR